MGKALPEDLPACAGARSSFGVWYDGHDFAKVAERLSMGPLSVSARWVQAIWDRFMETDSVQSKQGRRTLPSANQVLDVAAMQAIVDELLDNPEYTLQEHHEGFESATGKHIHISTFCRAVWRCGFTRQKVRINLAGAA